MYPRVSQASLTNSNSSHMSYPRFPTPHTPVFPRITRQFSHSSHENVPTHHAPVFPRTTRHLFFPNQTSSVFESFLESKPESSVDLAQKSESHTTRFPPFVTPHCSHLSHCHSSSSGGLLKWLLARLKIRAFHANKLYASELLSLLLHRNAENQRTLSDADGVLGLLTAVSQYKRKDPQDAEEAELVENVFDCLSAALEQPRNKLHFLKAEGIELMILTIKERRYASRGALKALAAALHADGASCERFVDIRGFKTLFPLLGAQPPPPPFVTKGAAVERRRAQRCHDLDTAACVCALFSQLEGERRQRLLGKFAEEDYGKLERLLDMHANYDRTLAEAEAAAADAVEEDADDEASLTKL